MLKHSKIDELLNEKACSHSSTKSSSCNKPTPGNTTGGCAFEGAQIALFPYADAAHLVHGPITCLGASWESRATLTSYSGTDFTQMGFTTDISENDVIFGGDKKLAESIDYIYKHYSPEAIFVYFTCVTALIGDDVESVCKESKKKYDIPIVPIFAPGFTGSKNLGSRIAGENVLESLIGTKEPANLGKYNINLIGDFNVTGDMWQYTHLLEELGINVLSTLSGDGRVAKIRGAHRADLNVIVCAKALISLVRKMEEKYEIPYISVSFYGLRDTTNAILSIANALGDLDLIKRAKELCDREERKTKKALEPYIKNLSGKKALLNTGGNKSWSIASALQDLEMEVVATSIRKCTEDDIQKCKETLGENAILMKSPANEQAKILSDFGVDILLAGGRSLYTAIKKKISFIDVNQEKKISYGGYDGLVNFAKDLNAIIKNPVFKNVSKVAPWENLNSKGSLL